MCALVSTLSFVFLFGDWLQMKVLWIQTGPGLVQALANCGGCGRGTQGGLLPLPPSPSSVFEVLSGQGTLSLGLSLSSVRLSVCVRPFCGRWGRQSTGGSERV